MVERDTNLNHPSIPPCLTRPSAVVQDVEGYYRCSFVLRRDMGGVGEPKAQDASSWTSSGDNWVAHAPNSKARALEEIQRVASDVW